MNWSKEEEELLIQLRKSNVPYREKVQIWKARSDFPNRTQDSLRNHMNFLRNGEKVLEQDQEVIGVFDIETTDLKADIGFMMSWAMYYPLEDRIVSDVITKRDVSSLRFDEKICKSLLKELDKVSLLIGYYSTNFDVPFVRTRCLMNGLGFPGYGSLRHIDCFYAARGKVATSRKSLGVIAEALGLQEKEHEPRSVWRKARVGDTESLAKLLEYNKNDCVVTWQVYNELKKYGRIASKSI